MRVGLLVVVLSCAGVKTCSPEPELDRVAVVQPSPCSGLTQAVLDSDAAALRRRVAAHEDVNAADLSNDSRCSHKTPLLVAVERRDEKMVKELLALGAKPNLSNPFVYTVPRFGRNEVVTPLCLAIATGERGIEGRLRELGAEEASRSCLNTARFHASRRTGAWSGVDVHAIDPLLLNRSLAEELEEGDVETALVLRDAGAPVDETRSRIFSWSSRPGSVGVQAAYAAGLQLRPDPWAVLHAMKAGNFGALEAYLDAGVPDDELEHALGVAVLETRRVELIRYLAQRHAWSTSPRESLLGFVARARNGDARMVVALLDAGYPIDLAAQDGETPLGGAVRQGSEEMVNVLIAHGADVNATGGGGQTPLEVAERQKRPSVVSALLAAGAQRSPPATTASSAPPEPRPAPWSVGVRPPPSSAATRSSSP